MRIEALTKVIAPEAKGICALATAGGYNLESPEKLTPLEFLAELLDRNSLVEALQFLAFALPPREAVWWASTCARAELRDPVSQPVLNAIEAAETWVRRPTDEHRRAAMDRARATDFDTPGAWAAVAAFWSGGSMAPLNMPEVPPPPHLVGVAVAGAVALAAVQSEPQHADEKRERFLASAVDIANGGSGRGMRSGT